MVVIAPGAILKAADLSGCCPHLRCVLRGLLRLQDVQTKWPEAPNCGRRDVVLEDYGNSTYTVSRCRTGRANRIDRCVVMFSGGEGNLNNGEDDGWSSFF